MKITPAAPYRPYISVSTGGSIPESGGSAVAKTDAAAKKTDQVSLSGEASFKSVLARMGGAIARDVEGAVSEQRVEQLKSEVEGDTYYATSASIADAFLDSYI